MAQFGHVDQPLDPRPESQGSEDHVLPSPARQGSECLGASGFLLSPAWSAPSPLPHPTPLQVPLPSQRSINLSGVQTLSPRL